MINKLYFTLQAKSTTYRPIWTEKSEIWVFEFTMGFIKHQK